MSGGSSLFMSYLISEEQEFSDQCIFILKMKLINKVLQGFVFMWKQIIQEHRKHMRLLE